MKFSISSFSVLIIFSVFTLIGFALVPFLPLQFLPSTQSSNINVYFQWAETSPEIIEQQVTTPLEGAFNLIEGVRRIYSISKKGRGNIQLEFDKHVDIELLRLEIATKIRQLYTSLPVGLTYPQISINRPEKEMEERPLLIYSVSSENDPTELLKYTKEVLSPQLAMTDGLQFVKVEGGNKKEWRITYNEEQLQVLDIKEEDIQKALRELFYLEALGVTQKGSQTIFVNLKNNTQDEDAVRDDLTQVPITHSDGRTILLGDLATISLEEEMPRRYYRINSNNSIRLLFYAAKNTNQIELAKRIKKNIQELSHRLPPSYTLYMDEDATVYLSEELNKIILRSSLSLGILLLFVLLTYRSWRHLLIILFSLLANLSIAFILYYWLQIEMHLYALAGITISFGIIIDNSIVMVHHLRSQSNLKIFPALLTATLTTISALVIIWFLPDLWKMNLLNFAKVIMINLGVSLVIALFLIPALIEAFFSKRAAKKVVFSKKKKIVGLNNFYAFLLKYIFRFRKTAILLVVLLFGLPVFLLPDKIENKNWYNDTFGSEYFLDTIKPWANKWLGGTLRLFNDYVYEGANYQDIKETILYASGSMPNGNTAAQMNEVYQQLEVFLDQYLGKGIQQYTTIVSSGQYAITQIKFDKTRSPDFPFLLKEEIVRFCINLGGVKWNIYGVGASFNNKGGNTPLQYRLKMLGYNKETLKEKANIFAEKLVAHPRIKEVNIEANVYWWIKDLYQYEIEFEKGQLANYNLNPQKVIGLLNVFNQSTFPDSYTPKKRAIRLISDRQSNNNLWMLKNKMLNVDSTFVQFLNFISLEKKKVVGEIHKENQQYLRMVEFKYIGSATQGQKYLEQCMKEVLQEVPLGFSIEEDGYNWDKDKQHQGWLVFIIVGFIFLICSIMFESYRQALAIVLLIPTSFIGIFLTFYWFDFNFDQGGYASFILLSGIVVNSIIFIVNDYNQFTKQFPGRSNLRNYHKAFQYKINPILLTILSTSLGLIPFLLQGANEIFWFPLAVGTIGGLLFSLLVILFIVPLFIVKKK